MYSHSNQSIPLKKFLVNVILEDPRVTKINDKYTFLDSCNVTEVA